MVTTAQQALLAISVSALSGCYLSHGLSSNPEPDAARDAAIDAPRDAGTDAGHVLPPPPDAAFDAGDVLPPEPDPDLGPDARPSDYVDAGTWVDPPPPSDADPCCVLGEVVKVTSRDDGMALEQEPPRIAWGPGVWGLLATRLARPPDWTYGEDPVVFELAQDGTPVAAPRVLDHAGRAGALHYAEGRWAVAIHDTQARSGDLRPTLARLFDRQWRPASAWLDLGTSGHLGVDVARLTHSDRWLGVLVTHEPSLLAVPFDEAGVGSGVERPVAPVTGSVHAVGLRSRVVSLTAGDDGTRHDEIEVIGAPPELALLARLPLEVASSARAITSLRDLVLVASVVGSEVRVDVIDPFAFTRVAGPVGIGTSPATDSSNPDVVDVEGSDKLGLAGVCYGVSAGADARGPRTLQFRLVGPDGLPRGAAVEVVETPFRGGLVNCAVGSDDQGFLVGWWDGSALAVRRVDLAP